MPEATTVGELGESALVARIAATLGSPPAGEMWAGDDAAVVPWGAARLVLTIDAVTEGMDFDFAYATPADAGFKAIAVNASDVAAMGARPRHAVCAMTLPRSTPVATVDGVLAGMIEAARTWEIALVGGDIGEAGELTLAIAMTGEPVPGGPVTRSGARPGMALGVTGALGGAAAGLRALRAGATGEAVQRLARRQLRPRARVAEAAELCRAGAAALIDLSDGLAVDLGRLCDASGAGCDVDAGALPLDPDLDAAGVTDALELALCGGEDYELLCALEPGAVVAASAALRALGVPFTVVGEITDGPAVVGGTPLDEWRRKGWEHLRGR